MEIYRFKCKCCGATRYKKPTKNIYRCLYCGEEVEVYRKADVEQPAPQPVQQTQVEPQASTATEAQTKTKKKEPKMETKNMVLLVACLRFGWFGLHKFMKGQLIWGLIYAFTGGVMGIGVFIDAMVFAIDAAKDVKNYNREKSNFEK